MSSSNGDQDFSSLSIDFTVASEIVSVLSKNCWRGYKEVKRLKVWKNSGGWHRQLYSKDSSVCIKSDYFSAF